MMKESTLQAKIKKRLEEAGAVVLKYPQNAYSQKGVSDLIWFYHSLYGFLEVKASPTAPFRPGQREFLSKMSRWTLAEAINPENQEEVLGRILDRFRTEDETNRLIKKELS